MKKHTVRRVLLLIRPYRFTVVGSLLLALASVASQLLIPIFSGRAIDAMVGKGRVDLDAVALAVAAIALIALLGALAQDMLARCNNRITFSVSRDLRSRISSKLNRLPLSYLDTHPTGDTVSRTVADRDARAELEDRAGRLSADAAFDLHCEIYHLTHEPLLSRAGAHPR